MQIVPSLAPATQFVLLLTGIAIAPLFALVAGHGVLDLARTKSGWLSRRWPKLRDDWPVLLGLALVVGIAAFVFFNIVEDLMEGDPSLAIDRATYLYLRGLRSPWRDTVMIGITELGDAVVVTTIAVVIALRLAIIKAWRPLAYWLAAVAGGSILNTAIKVALHRQRPIDLHHTGWDAFSFPSGHSTTNAVLYGFLALLIATELPRVWRWPLGWATGCLVLLIAFSRLYLGAHWLSDVAGGLAFGSIWIAGLGVLYIGKPHKPVGGRVTLLLALAALIVTGGVNMVLHHDSDLKLYEVRAQD